MKADQLNQEWEKVKSLTNKVDFLNQVESLLEFDKVRITQEGKVEHYQYQIPQDLISVARYERFKSSEKYIFTGLLSWKKKNKSIVSKKLIVFSSHHGACCQHDFFDLD